MTLFNKKRKAITLITQNAKLGYLRSKIPVPFWAILLLVIMCSILLIPGFLTFLALIGIK